MASPGSGWDTEGVLRAYARGLFPMADERGRLGWYASREHALLPICAPGEPHPLHVPRSLHRRLNDPRFEERRDANFREVVRACAEDREDTWISEELRTLYDALHAVGAAHSMETHVDGKLAGGVFGLTIGRAFIAESMVTRTPEAGKVALVRLTRHLVARGFTLLDAQVMNPHLERFAAYPVSERVYAKLLARAVQGQARY